MGDNRITQIRRRQLFVDRKLQGALLVHASLYWFYCLVAVTVLAIGWIVLSDFPRTSADLFQKLGRNYGPALFGAILLLPIVLLDCLRLSNRFAGPMVRIQRAMNQLANGETPEKIKVRDGDYWSQCANDLNRVIDRAAPCESVHASPRASGGQVGRDAQTPRSNNVDANSIYSDTSA